MLENPWFINISCGILLPLCWYIINYFKDEECWKRKRLKCCKQAIHNMIQRFNISVCIIGSGGGHIHGPILTYQNYILVLYELYFVLNNWDSSKISNQTFLNDALSWHKSYVNQNMRNAIEVYSVLEIEELLHEVESYGKNGKSFLSSICPNFVRYFYKLRNKIYNLKNVIIKENKIMNNNENYKPVFSWTYALWGVFGYFFHRKNMNKLPFWKSAGVDILVWGFLIGIVSKITAMFCVQSTVLDILHTIIFMAIWGFVGAWRFNKFKKNDYDVELYKEREMIGIMSGIITYFIVFVLSLVVFSQAHYI